MSKIARKPIIIPENTNQWFTGDDIQTTAFTPDISAVRFNRVKVQIP